jgi:hypothetical protein
MDKQQNPSENKVPFESDTHKIVRRHLEDRNHVITDEEIASVRVGMSPPPDAPTEQAIREAEDRISDHKSAGEEDNEPGAQKITPWDTIDPS